MSSCEISSCILPRKFYLCSPLLSGGIACWSAHSPRNTAMRYRNQWLLQCERIHYYSVSARLQNELFYDQRLAIPCKPKHFAPRPALMPLKFSPSWYLCPVHAVSFRHDIVGEYQITQRRTLSPMAQTSSDPEVVGDLLVCVFTKKHRDGIAHHIVTTAKSVLNLYLHAQFCMILQYWNHIRTVADRGRRITQLLC